MDSPTDSSLWGDDLVRNALADEIEVLHSRGATSRIVEFDVDGVTVWTVSRDDNGTPRATPDLLPTTYLDPDLFYQQGLAPRIGTTGLRIVSSLPAADPHREAELRVLRARRPDAPFHRCPTPVKDLLRQVVRESPITRFYDLVALAEKGKSRRLVMENHPLFAPGARRGDTETFRVRCLPAGPYGTVFAVVTRDPEGDTAVESAISVSSAPLTPGSYTVTATLDRPGRVNFEFEGLSVDLRPDSRRINAMFAALPQHVVRLPPVHLICLIEVSGARARVQDRIDRLVELIGMVDTPDREVRISVVSYGPHSFDPMEREESVQARAWVVEPGQALIELSDLRGQPQARDEFTLAAQLECALAEIARHLDIRDGRPILVTAGSRPPHPPRADYRAPRIIRCPDGQDWRYWLDQLAGLQGITFGAFTERESFSFSPAWDRLGRNALGAVTGTSMAQFAAALGLAAQAPPIPFPMLVEA